MPILNTKWRAVRRSQLRRSKGNRRPSQSKAGVKTAHRMTPTIQDNRQCHHGVGSCARNFCATAWVKKKRPNTVHTRTYNAYLRSPRVTVFAIRAVAYLKRGNWPNDELNADNKPFSGVETGMERRTKTEATLPIEAASSNAAADQ